MYRWEAGEPQERKDLMRFFALASVRVSRWTALGLVLVAFGVLTVQAQDDPPDQAGRISALFGTVSIQPAGSQDWGQVYTNLPVGPGDRIYTDQDGTVEVQVGQTYLRIGPNTDITLVGDDANGVTWGLAQGSVHLRSYGLWQGQVLNVSTPNGNGQLNTAGELRLDALPNQEATIFSSISGGLVVSGAGGFWQEMGNSQSLELAGINPVYPQWLQPVAPDYLDQWSRQRDEQIANAYSYRYVNPEVPGAAELDADGDWIPDSDYGPMWYPRNVSADWQPYHYGHWINRQPWGWVWVEDERWGYAPFHYGRWVMYRGRWGWVPGPREVRPVWSPALVVFASGGNVGGVGLSAWFPLGPGEAYRPWYRCSPHYIDRVNISNIHESREVHVRNTYVNIVNVRNVTYVNRKVGVSAMRPDDFAAGRPVRQAAVQVDRRQFDHVQVVDRPAEATRQSFVTRPVARPVPVTVADKAPVFINKQGMQISARPGAAPVQPQVRQIAPPQPVPGRTVVAPPPGSRYPNASQPAQQGGNGQPSGPSARPVGRPATQQDNSPRQFPGLGGSPNVPQNQPQPPVNNAPKAQPQPPAQQTPNGQPSGPSARPVGRPASPQDNSPRQLPGQGAPPNAPQNQPQPPANNPPKAQPQPPANNAPPTQNAQPQQKASPPANRQDYGPVEPSKRPDTAPTQPPTVAKPNPQPAQPQQPQQPQAKPQPRQDYGQQKQGHPQDHEQDQARPNKNDNNQNKDQNNKKDQKKDEKKKEN